MPDLTQEAEVIDFLTGLGDVSPQELLAAKKESDEALIALAAREPGANSYSFSQETLQWFFAYRLIVAGWPKQVILVNMMDHFGVSVRVAELRYAQARQSMLDVLDVHKDELFAEAIGALREIRRQSPDFKVQLEAVKEFNRLLDLYPIVRKQSLSINVNADLAKLSDDELEQIARGETPAALIADSSTSTGTSPT